MVPKASVPGLGRGSPKTLRFLDIGFGSAARIARYARKPRSKNRLFYGIESEKQRTLVSSRQKNVKLMFGKAEERLKKIPSNSLHVVNMDFFPLTTQEGVVNGFTKQGIPRIELHTRVLFPKLMGEVWRVLKKNGRVCITVPAGAVGEMDIVLFQNGFKESSFTDVPKTQRDATPDMRGHFDLAKTHPDAIPVRMIAVKRVRP